MVVPAAADPSEVQDHLWEGFHGKLAFEVGANCGHSLPLMMSLFTQVVAFEPFPGSYEEARQVPYADVRNIAISDHDGELDLIFHGDQLLSEGHEAFHRPNLDERLMPTDIRTVPCRTLDGIADAEGHPDFVNVDTEGHELAILHGAARLLTSDKPPSWLIEFHSEKLHDACVSCLEEAGYEVETVRHPHYPEKSVNWFQHGWLRAIHPNNAS